MYEFNVDIKYKNPLNGKDEDINVLVIGNNIEHCVYRLDISYGKQNYKIVEVKTSKYVDHFIAEGGIK